MKTRLLALVALLLAPLARADITMTVQDTLVVSAALAALDNAPAPGRPEHPPYKFSAETTWRIVDLKLALTSELDKARAVVTALETQHPDKEKTPEAKAAYDKEYKALTEKAVKLKCPPLKRADFDLDHNPIPPDILVALAPVTVP